MRPPPHGFLDVIADEFRAMNADDQAARECSQALVDALIEAGWCITPIDDVDEAVTS